MGKRSVSFPHIAALSMLFVIGNGVVVFPFRGSNQFGFSAYLVSVILLLILYPLVSIAVEKIKLPTALKLFGLIGSAVFALFCAAQSFSDLIGFVSRVVLSRTPKFFIAVILGFTVLYFVTRKKENLIKFSLISGVLTLLVVIFFFAAASPKYDLQNIFIFRLPDGADFCQQIEPYLINPLIHSFLLPVYFKLAFQRVYVKEGTVGSLTGAVLLGMCVLASILLFGADFAGELSYPFNSAVSTVNVGRLFTRLDGFAYFIYFVCGLIKITMCVSLSVLCLKKVAKSVDKGKK